MNLFKRLTLGFLAVVFLFSSGLWAAVRLPHVFGDNMVLQQGKPVVVWGWADPQEDVTVQVGDNKQSAKANAQGEWKVSLPALKASVTPVTFVVTGKNTLTLQNVLIGEVWLCSGQSNMEMGIKQVLNPEAEIAGANYPTIRLFLVPKKFETVPQLDVDATWKVCTPQSILEGGWGGFSAAAYFFGRELSKNLNVPIGLIESAWGGTRIEPWTPTEGFASVPALSSLYEKVLISDPRTPEHAKQVESYIQSLEAWSSSAKNATANKKPLTPSPVFPQELGPFKDQQQSTALYNGMVYALQPLSMRGIIWYQGESNHIEGKLYTDKTRALVNGWRKVLGQDDLPFYYTLIAPYQYGTELPTVVPEFWEAQAAALDIPNTGMAVTTDIGDLKDIHPKNKQEVGRRLALWALAKTYGKAEIVYSGPIYKSFTVEGNKLKLSFNHIGGGLISTDGKPLSHFEIIDEAQGGFVPATAVIEGSTVVLSAPNVNKPAAFRFAWHKLAEPNFANKEKLPAIPFRGGTVPNRDVFSMLGGETVGYQLVYDLDFSKLGKDITYQVDDRTKITKPFTRIAYFMELTTVAGVNQYVFVSMDAFTNDLSKIGVPTLSSGAIFQQKVENMTVMSNVPNVTNGENLKGGNIEFWANNYSGQNALNIPNANNRTYDFGDQIAKDAPDGYGSMQVHNYEAKQTVFALNHWADGANYDIGIGNAAAENTDWTFAKNAGQYKSKRLRVFVK